jgi:mono/diheme cytochrome c family protein
MSEQRPGPASGGEGLGGGPESVEWQVPTSTDGTVGSRTVPDARVAAHEEARPGHGGELEPDVERLHRAIAREPHDPEEGRERAPWWIWSIAALALFWGGWYLGRHGGSFGPQTHVAFAGTEEYVSEQARDAKTGSEADPVAAGQRIYMQNCQSCHQATGRGVPGAFPPLVGSEWVTGDPATVVRILLHGLQGPVQVAGQSYSGAMPPWKDALRDEEIAAVATYIRQWDENDAPAVEAELVTRLRAEARPAPWTALELQAAGSPAGASTDSGIAQ